jgi:glycosyltransferase A (GT-A) superfamily protein (DUF2064 family)
MPAKITPQVDCAIGWRSAEELDRDLLDLALQRVDPRRRRRSTRSASVGVALDRRRRSAVASWLSAQSAHLREQSR